MKKGGVKASGAITLIMYLPLFVISLFYALSLFIDPIGKLLVDVEILGKIVMVITSIFIDIPLLLINNVADLSPELMEITLPKIFAIVLAVFCLYMIFWGIKEISLGKKDDYRFAKCKKTCAFMHIIKFMVFAFLVAMIVCCFLVEEINLIYIEAFSKIYGVPYLLVIVAGVLAFLTFLCFVLAVANINKVARAVKKGEVQQDPNAMGGDPNYQQNGGYNQNVYNQPQQNYQGAQMQANMPPMNNYQPQYNSQPQQPQYNPQPQPQQPMANNGATGMIVPGQNGIPINITQKGIQDLERLERLRQSGAITESNYIIMRTKICNSNLS